MLFYQRIYLSIYISIYLSIYLSRDSGPSSGLESRTQVQQYIREMTYILRHQPIILFMLYLQLSESRYVLSAAKEYYGARRSRRKTINQTTKNSTVKFSTVGILFSFLNSMTLSEITQLYHLKIVAIDMSATICNSLYSPMPKNVQKEQ